MATFAFATGDRAGAESFSVQCNSRTGTWYVAGSYNPGSVSDIPCDEAKPGWAFKWGSNGEIQFLYDGDRVVTPYERGGVIRSTVRPVAEQGNTRPPVNQPLADGTNHAAFTFQAGPNNRAVRGSDGNCYREQRIGGQWRRSGSYGADAAACRRASWNAHYRAEGEPLLNPASGTFQGGQPPPRDSRGRVVTPTRLVSNLNQSTSGWATWRSGRRYAQQFRTGSLPQGNREWILTAVEFWVRDQSASDTSTPTFTVSIRDVSSGVPGSTVLGTLDPPDEFGGGVRTLTAGDGIRLSANTNYFILVEVTTEASGIGQWATPSDDEDSGASPGWSIHDAYSYTNSSGNWVHSTTRAYKIAVTGYAR